MLEDLAERALGGVLVDGRLLHEEDAEARADGVEQRGAVELARGHRRGGEARLEDLQVHLRVGHHEA